MYISIVLLLYIVLSIIKVRHRFNIRKVLLRVTQRLIAAPDRTALGVHLLPFLESELPLAKIPTLNPRNLLMHFCVYHCCMLNLCGITRPDSRRRKFVLTYCTS